MSENHIFLAKLNDKIALLTEQFSTLTTIKRESPCFDIHLFNYQGALAQDYSPYLSELNNNYQQLVTLINRQQDAHYIEQIIYLSELIVNQLVAMQRELASYPLRKIEKSSEPNQTLDEQYAKNLGYLSRLESMKYELQQLTTSNQREKERQLTILDGRIARCRDYLTQLEQSID